MLFQAVMKFLSRRGEIKIWSIMQMVIWSCYANLRSLSLFISLEIDCFLGLWTQKYLHSMTKRILFGTFVIKNNWNVDVCKFQMWVHGPARRLSLAPSRSYYWIGEVSFTRRLRMLDVKLGWTCAFYFALVWLSMCNTSILVPLLVECKPPSTRSERRNLVKYLYQ